jgi:Phage tail tube protein, GTA-gp10
MPIHAEIVREWADGTYNFRIGIGEIGEIEKLCDAGILRIAERVIAPDCKIQDYLVPIRVGLVGGGMDPVEARRLVERYALPYVSNIGVAYDLLRVAAFGPEDEPLPKSTAETETGETSASPMESSDSPPSTNGESSLDSAPLT